MKINRKYSFTPKNRRNKDLYKDKSFQNKKKIINQNNIVQLEEPTEELFHPISPRKSKKIKSEEDEDDIYKTEMNNKKPLELFQDITNDNNENNKSIEIKQKIDINSYDNDNSNNILIDKSNISVSFSKLIANDINSNDKIDETNNSTVKLNTVNTIEESKNNDSNRDLKKLMKFCKSMMNKKSTSKIINMYNLYNKSKKIKANNINDYKNGDNIYNHFSFFHNLKDNKSGFIKTKLIRRTPRNNRNNIYDNETSNKFFENSKQNNDNDQNSKISFENSVSFCNKSNINKKFKSAINSSRAHSLMNKQPFTINNQNSLYIESSRKSNKNNLRSFSYSKFIYKKRIIKMNQNKVNKDINIVEKLINNKNCLKNKLSTKSFRKEKESLNTFRLNNTKSTKRNRAKNETQFVSKRERPINLKNTNFYSSIYESLINKQKENCKNNIIIQNFNNYNLNTYNSNRNINPNYINFKCFSKNNNNEDEEEKINKTTDEINNKRKNIILDIKINKRCLSKNS